MSFHMCFLYSKVYRVVYIFVDRVISFLCKAEIDRGRQVKEGGRYVGEPVGAAGMFYLVCVDVSLHTRVRMVVHRTIIDVLLYI